MLNRNKKCIRCKHFNTGHEGHVGYCYLLHVSVPEPETMGCTRFEKKKTEVPSSVWDRMRRDKK